LAALPDSELENLGAGNAEDDDDWSPQQFHTDIGTSAQNVPLIPGTNDAQIVSKTPRNLLSAGDSKRRAGSYSAQRPSISDSELAPSADTRSSGANSTAPPTSPDRAKPPGQITGRTADRLVSFSYVEAGASLESSSRDEGRQERREQTDQAAIDFVVASEARSGRRAAVMDHSNPGFDIESFDPATGASFFIEVKGISGEWGRRGVMLSRTHSSTLRPFTRNVLGST
jgi:hypothetical protein